MNLDKLINFIRKAINKPEKVDAKIGFGFWERTISMNWFNPLLTIWVNLRSFPLIQAVKFPIFVYGMPKIFGLSGKMRVIGPISIGMIKFNMTDPSAPSNMGVQSSLCNLGTILFYGKGSIGTGNKIDVYGTLKLGGNFKIADMINLCCWNKIDIGEGTRIAHRCQLLDSNYHYIANLKKRVIPNCDAPIIVGRYCWICNTTTVTCGAVLPDNVIVSAYSLVNKDYSAVERYSLIGGIPAKCIASCLTRVWDDAMQKEILDYFESNTEAMPMPDSATVDTYNVI